MTGPRKGTREKAFAKRLDKALNDFDRAPAEYGRQAWLKRELAHFNMNVSDETVSRWLKGKMMPRRDKMSALAQLLRVDEIWLAMGTKPADLDLDPVDAVERAQVVADALRKLAADGDPEVIKVVRKLCSDVLDD